MSIIENAIKPGNMNVNGRDVYYYGKYPRRKTIFISSSKEPSKIMKEQLYLVAFEAARNGFDVVAIPNKFEDDPVYRAVCDGNGVYHAVLPFGLSRLARRKISEIIIRGGSVISASVDDSFSLEGLNVAKSNAADISDIVIIGEEKIYKSSIDGYISGAIDSGKPVAVLKCALVSRFLRSLVYEGCPAIFSLSEFMFSPKVIAYPSFKGRYGQGGLHFDIMNIEGDYV